jgi:RNA polymerase sigma factor (sigma-70 family)
MDIKEYNLLATQFNKSLFSFVLKQLKDVNESEDIVQDCFLKLWERVDRVEYEKAKSWLFIVAKNSLINRAAQIKRKCQLLETDNFSYQPRTDFDVAPILHSAINSLKGTQRAILKMRDIDGYNYAEIGDTLNLNQSQVKVYLFRARNEVKKKVAFLVD